MHHCARCIVPQCAHGHSSFLVHQVSGANEKLPFILIALYYKLYLLYTTTQHIRGRFALSLYREMKITELVATNITHYVEITLRLIRDESFWCEQALNIRERFALLAQENNRRVAKQWAHFIVRATL